MEGQQFVDIAAAAIAEHAPEAVGHALELDLVESGRWGDKGQDNRVTCVVQTSRWYMQPLEPSPRSESEIFVARCLR